MLSYGIASFLFTPLSFYSSLIAAESEAALDLAGTVKSKSGTPVANASIFIYTAGPRKGTGYL